MPELPELEAHAARLRAGWVGAVLTRFHPLSFTVMKTVDPDPNVATGRPLTHVGRRGKYLICDFDGIAFVVHLMQGGRLRTTPPAKGPKAPRGAQARWSFDGSDDWLLTEAGKERRVGVWVFDRRQGPSSAEAELFADLGPDAETLTAARLGERLRSRSGRLHNVLRDQRVIAGIGRRLANDLCHEAKLSPFVSTGRLTDDQVLAVHGALSHLVERDLAFETTQEELVNTAKRPTNVHRRMGDPCPNCGEAIREVTYASHVVNYCPTCQTGGRLLADNTTSKFLK